MSFEPPSLDQDNSGDQQPDRIELTWKKTPGYASKHSQSQDAAIGLVSMLIHFGLMIAFMFFLTSAGVPVTPAVVLAMIIFYGGGLFAYVRYERWLANLAAPRLVVPSVIRSGDDIMIEVHGDQMSIDRCEIVETQTRTFRTQSGSSAKRNNRVWSRELDRVTGPNDNDAIRFRGEVSRRSARFASKWFIAVHLRHDLPLGHWRYVRPFSIQLQPRDPTS